MPWWQSARKRNPARSLLIEVNAPLAAVLVHFR
jgi:hypothetical protein